MDKISVIIPTYNAETTLEACLRSIIATGYTPLEIIVGDDYSSDSSPAIVARLAAEFPGIVNPLSLPGRSGPAKVRNAGARVATGTLLFFLDSDTVMDKMALARFAERILDADAVVGIYDAEPLNSGLAARYKGYLNHYFFSRNGVIPYEVFDASRAGIRADVFADVGGYNEALTWGMDFENEDLGYRLIKAGYRMLLDPSIHVRHHFPDFTKLTRTYFTRVAQWMEIFLIRRRFESGGVTSAGTGISTASLLLAFGLLPFLALTPYMGLTSLVCVGIYFYGYQGFFRYVLARRPSFLGPAILLNVYFTMVLALGASTGLSRVIAGRSQMRRVLGENNLH